jgi:hypothetical protein
MGPDVRFRTYSDADARSVRLQIYIPEFKPWSTAPGEVDTIDAGGKTLGKKVLKTGLQTVVLPIAKTALSASGEAAVHLRLTDAHVPKDFGLNADPRNISAMLVSVTTI